MATIITGSIIADIRGSVGSETYSRNAFGAYVKSRVTPANPNTVPQQMARTRLTNAVTAWQGLSDIQRLAYITEARERSTINRLGIKTRMTGYTLFIRQHIACVQAGLPVGLGIEGVMLPDIMQQSNLDFSSTFMRLTNDFAVTDAEIKGFLFSTPPRIASQVSFNPSTARLLSVIPSVAGSNIVNFLGAFTSIFGAPGGSVGKSVSIALATVRPRSSEYSAQLWHTSQIAA